MKAMRARIRNPLAAALTVAALLTYVLATPFSATGDLPSGAGTQSCCCSMAADAAPVDPCRCECEEDACGTAPCPNVLRTVQPLLGSTWFFDRPLAPWSALMTAPDQAFSRATNPLVPPPITA